MTHSNSTSDEDDLDALLEPRQTIARLRAELEAAKNAARGYRDRLAEHEPQAAMSPDDFARVWATVEAMPDDEAIAEMQRLGMIQTGGPTVQPNATDDGGSSSPAPSAPIRSRSW
jgi:hypothetical protein